MSRIEIIKKVRKSVNCSLEKAKNALEKSNYDFDAAILILGKESINNSILKAEKLRNRSTCEGLVGVTRHPTGLQAGLFEVNCETDFVSKSEIFRKLVEMVSNHGLLFQEPSGDIFTTVNIKELLHAPLFLDSHQSTLDDELRMKIGLLGENIKIRRGLIGFPHSNVIYGSYAHSSLNTKNVGRIGCLVALKVLDNDGLEMKDRVSAANQLAQHILGFSPSSINGSNNSLLSQSFLFGGGLVRDYLHSHNLKCIDFQRWECGEGLEKDKVDFASEVKDLYQNR